MNKTTIVVGIIIFAIVFWLIGFVNTLHADGESRYRYDDTASTSKNKNHITVNTYGDEVLLLNNLSLQEKKNLWNKSNLKVTMLELFPHFIQMKDFVKKHVEDDGAFKKKLLSNIEHVEFEYVGGSLNGESATLALSNF